MHRWRATSTSSMRSLAPARTETPSARSVGLSVPRKLHHLPIHFHGDHAVAIAIEGTGGRRLRGHGTFKCLCRARFEPHDEPPDRSHEQAFEDEPAGDSTNDKPWALQEGAEHQAGGAEAETEAEERAR